MNELYKQHDAIHLELRFELKLYFFYSLHQKLRHFQNSHVLALILLIQSNNHNINLN